MTRFLLLRLLLPLAGTESAARITGVRHVSRNEASCVLSTVLIVKQALDTRTPLDRPLSAAAENLDVALPIPGPVVLDVTPSTVTARNTRIWLQVDVLYGSRLGF
jgi:hypothetical protein